MSISIISNQDEDVEKNGANQFSLVHPQLSLGSELLKLLPLKDLQTIRVKIGHYEDCNSGLDVDNDDDVDYVDVDDDDNDHIVEEERILRDRLH